MFAVENSYRLYFCSYSRKIKTQCNILHILDKKFYTINKINVINYSWYNKLEINSFADCVKMFIVCG